MVNFRYNCTRGQLNNEGEGELQELTQRQDKTEIGKEIIYKEQTNIFWSHSPMTLFYHMKSSLYNAFIFPRQLNKISQKT